MLSELRHALRVLLKAPVFSALVVAVLAVGIGATTTMFSVVNGVLLKPLPFADASRLISVHTLVRGEPDDTSNPDAASMHAAVVALDRDQPPGEVKTLTSYLARSIAAPRFTAMLIGSFAVTALLLAAVGLFSVMAYAVVQRRREIGIRMALGAQPSDVRRLVVSQALGMGLAGLGVGLAGALAVGRVLGSLLFNVSATDPVTFAGVCGLLLAAVLAAAYLPARRATRVEPMVALRAD